MRKKITFFELAIIIFIISISVRVLSYKKALNSNIIPTIPAIPTPAPITPEMVFIPGGKIEIIEDNKKIEFFLFEDYNEYKKGTKREVYNEILDNILCFSFYRVFLFQL